MTGRNDTCHCAACNGAGPPDNYWRQEPEEYETDPAAEDEEDEIDALRADYLIDRKKDGDA